MADSTQHQLTVSGQLRPRFELRSGAFRPLGNDEKPAALISERVRLTFDYTFKDKLQVKFSPQTVGIWGQESMVQGAETSGNQLAFFEAWARLILSPTFDVKVGRQVISLDEERFFGELDWAQGGRAHDAVSLNFHKGKFELNGFLAFNQNYRELYNNNLSNPAGNLYNSVGAFPYKHMQTLWSGINICENSKITLLINNLGIQNAAPSSDDAPIDNIQTLGANYFLNTPKVSANASAYYQQADNEFLTDVKAYMLAAGASFKAGKGWTVGIGSDFISGNDFGLTLTENHAFTPFFATGHKFFGSMDYFYAGNGHKGVGISDTYLQVSHKFSNVASVGAVFHQFFTPNKVLENVNKQYDKNLGQELDLSFSYKINNYTGLVGGYSFYLNNETIDYLKSVQSDKGIQHWAWLSLNITPVLYKSRF